MKNTILRLIERISSSLFWVKESKVFLKHSKTVLLSELHGSYTAKSLLVELGIRHQSSKKSGIETIGMTELIETISNLNPDNLIKNYVFKNQDKTGIIYLNEDSSIIIGAVLINR